ncbi:MAG: D-alanyl-D-alanine carboxypeptidase/D-alanyl-D-alanine-endopeptidase [Gammaproteobacteria bacterium]|nr:D-alanyl-D-alanine carboxypeptidase/D-alanyl-D-alanine-endopeptidase [Gammaproteobacteria bacterium]
MISSWQVIWLAVAGLWLGAGVYADISIGASDALPLELQRHLGKLGIPPAAVSLVVTEVDAEIPLIAWHADAPRNPASVMKIVTTFAALSELGPGYQWQSEIRRTGLIRNGTLEGDLVFVGGGDPYFVAEDLWSLVQQLELRGIHSVAGDFIIDNTYFDVPDHDAGAFDGRRYRPYNVGPGAALFNFGNTDFYLVPLAGRATVEIRHAPHARGLNVVSEVRQIAGACRGNRIKLRLNVEQQEGQYTVRFSGRYPASCGRYHLSRAVLPSDELLFGAFANQLTERGGELRGNLLIGTSPSDATRIMRVSSRTLAEVIRSINKFSNNVMSRQLFLTVGAHQSGAPATVEKAQRAVARILDEHKVLMPHLNMANGSGLCRDCTVTASGLIAMLQAAWNSTFMPEFFASLPVPGEDGALKNRFQSGKFKGRIHMKTGTIDHVSAAAGLVHGEGGRRYLFVLLMNHHNIHRGKGQAFQRRLMNWLTSLQSR